MYRQFLRKVKKGVGTKYRDIDPEDIFLDSANLPGFKEERFEGRIERPVSHSTFLSLKIVLVVIALIFGFKLWTLEIAQGELYAEISKNNSLSYALIFANRGVIYDRKGIELATNAIREEENEFSGRQYAPIEGLSHVVGYLRYPQSDSKGNYYDVNYQGRDGVEKVYNYVLAGRNGLKLFETNALGEMVSESVVEKPVDGQALTLALDAKLTEKLHKTIKSTAEVRGFTGGAGVIMDVRTGEILAMTSYPEYDANTLTSGKDKGAINSLITDVSKPFLNRVVSGLYSPGSIIKPIVALAALNEEIIAPTKQILSTGSISVPNPYDPEKPSVFRDWKAHGWTDMRRALAVSSDVYFYSIGGGYGGQQGLGIRSLDYYLNLFGLREKTGIDLLGERSGTIPNPEWKRQNFNGDIWRLGDTYITSIGQYGTQVTPISAARFIAAVANGGRMLVPSILKGGAPSPEKIERSIVFDEENYRIVREGMRDGVLYGTSVGLNMPAVAVAAKTGTAEVGTAKKYIHSWSVGFLPADAPRYAFAVIMEKGPADNPIGATSVMRALLDWMSINTPEYLRSTTESTI